MKNILNWIKESLNRININKNINIDNNLNNDDDSEHIIIGNKKKSLNEIKKKYKELQEKQNDN